MLKDIHKPELQEGLEQIKAARQKLVTRRLWAMGSV
jgi:hypothetical protein